MTCIKVILVSFALSNSNIFFCLELQELATRLQNNETSLYGGTPTPFEI